MDSAEESGRYEQDLNATQLGIEREDEEETQIEQKKKREEQDEKRCLAYI
jgi:hypothetical protein